MKKIYIIILIIGVIASITACSKSDKETGASFEALSTMSWDKIVEEAKKEKEVTWYVWYNQPKFRDVVQKFESEYGIKVTIPEGTLSGNTNKLIAEKVNKVGSIDVISFGYDGQILDIDGVLAGPLDFVPNVNKRIQKLGGVDSKGYAFMYWGNQTGIAYAPSRITENELPQSFDDMTAWIQKNPKLMGINDPAGGGAGKAFIREAVRNLNPEYNYDEPASGTVDWSKTWDWFNSNKDYYVITASNADSLTRLNDGEFILVPAWEDHLASLQSQGAISKDIKMYIPKMGMAGGGNFAGIAANAPHKAASLLLLWWITSAEVQTLFNQQFGAAPQNTDSDDSNALISNEMRSNALLSFHKDYETLLKKGFLEEVLVKGSK